MLRNLINDILAYLQGLKSVELVKDSLAFYRKNLIPICAISIPFFLPSAIVDAYSILIFESTGNAFLAKYSPEIVEHIFYPVAVGALIAFFSLTISGHKWAYSQCMTAGIISWPRLFIAAIIAEALITVGLFLLIIPGIILIALLGFYDFFVVLEKNGIFLSLKNSAALSKNHLVEIISSFLMLFAPVLWLSFVFHGPLSDILYSTKFASIVSNVFLSCLEIFILVLFFRLYCYLKNETHHNHLRTDTTQSNQ